MQPLPTTRRGGTTGSGDESEPPAPLDAAEAAAFRARCVAFLSMHATTDPAACSAADARGEHALAAGRRFQRALADAGLAGLTIPRRYGGQGLSEAHDRIWRDAAAAHPPMTAELSISLGNCLPTLMQFGTEEQKRRHVPELLAGREVWCQLFSEPNAGSDVAAVRTRAVRTDGGWLLSGQKVWTTHAHVCEYGILLARTDPDRPKHEGLSMFVLDLKAPGIEVRPIHQIDGGLHFNEVFLDAVAVSDDDLIPPEGGGWRVATGMMAHQRMARGTGMANGVLHGRADRLRAEARRRGADTSTVVRDELAALHTDEVCQSLVAMRTRDLAGRGRAPAASGSVAKLIGALLAAGHADLAHRVVGPDSQAWLRAGDGSGTDGGEERTAGAAGPGEGPHDDGRWAREGLTALSLSIAGGTNEIQRTIIGERVLGLPREPSVDRDVPFSAVACPSRTPSASPPASRRAVR